MVKFNESFRNGYIDFHRKFYSDGVDIWDEGYDEWSFLTWKEYNDAIREPLGFGLLPNEKWKLDFIL